MLESTLMGKKKIEEATDLIYGDLNLGYYGWVSAGSFINGTSLASAINLKSGTVIAENNNAGWLKFAYLGKTIYISKRALRQSIGWNQLYEAGAVYGDNTNGLYPSGTPINQSANVTILGKSYRVRLMRLADADPCPRYPFGGELSNLLIKVIDSAGGGLGTWGQYPKIDLSINQTGGAGNYNCWGIETSSRYSSERVILGGNLAPSKASTVDASSNSALYGWRPVLELVS